MIATSVKWVIRKTTIGIRTFLGEEHYQYSMIEASAQDVTTLLNLIDTNGLGMDQKDTIKWKNGNSGQYSTES